jgi:site-specific recombinase XerC
MREVMPTACWQVHRYDFARWREDRPAELGSYPPDLESWAGAYGERDGQRFLIGPDGRPDERVNAFLASPKMRNRAENTNRDYAYSLGVWLNFLLTTGRNWWEAAEDEVEAFQFWRLTDPRNGQAVEASSFARDVAACKSFYRWIGKRHAVVNPFEDYEPPRSRKGADVKWLDPAAVARWVGVGLRGLDLSGRADPCWQGRNEQRDAAFAEGLYGTGLRLGSWASVVLPELPGLARRWVANMTSAMSTGTSAQNVSRNPSFWTYRSGPPAAPGAS